MEPVKPKRGRPKKDKKQENTPNINKQTINNINTNYDNLDNKIIDITKGTMIIPKKTDIACWWCTYNFDNEPWFIPEKYDNNIFYVFGCFCSPNCALAYNQNLKDGKVIERHSYIKNLYSKITLSENCDNIISAPPKEILEKYGGPFTIEKFRDSFNTKKISLVMQPMIPMQIKVEII